MTAGMELFGSQLSFGC